MWLYTFSQMLRLRFKHPHEPEDLLKSIEFCMQALLLLPQDNNLIPGIQVTLGGLYAIVFSCGVFREFVL